MTDVPDALERQRSYGFTAKFLHWLLFALLAAQFMVGATMPHIGRNTPFEGWVAWHVWLGATVLFLIVVRLFWRLIRPVSLEPTSAKWERQLALFTHWFLYLFVLVMTILGWAAANFRGWDVRVFGVVKLPALAIKGDSWAHTAGDIHNFLVWPFLALIALHIAAAFYHYFVRKDRILQRMLPLSVQSRAK